MGVKERSLSSNVMEIRGGRRLTGGKVAVAGSSNQVTKCIIASLLTNDDVVVQGGEEVLGQVGGYPVTGGFASKDEKLQRVGHSGLRAGPA